MKKRLVLIAGLIAGSLVWSSPSLAEKAAPDFTLQTLGGESVTLSSFKGDRPVLVIFWATWCPYCRAGVPHLISWRKAIDESKLAMIGVSIQEEPAVVAEFAEKAGINYTVVLDTDSAVANRYKVGGIPHLFLIDREGNIVMDENASSREMFYKIKELTGLTSEPAQS